MLSAIALERRRTPVYVEYVSPASKRKVAIDILREVAKGKVTVKTTRLTYLALQYTAVTESYLRQIEMRDLITKNLRIGPNDKAIRVESSVFWYWAEVMGNKLLYVQETLDRQREKEESLTRTRSEWEAKEFDAVGYKPTLDEDDPRTVCAAWNCHTLYIRGKRGSKYCCVDCAAEQKIANARFRTHGTYLNVEDFKDKREATKSKRTARYEVLVADVEEHVRHASDIRNDGNSVTGSRPTMDGDESHAVKVWIPESSDEQRQPSVCWLDIVWDVRAEAFPKAEKWTKGRSSAATWRTLVGLE